MQRHFTWKLINCVCQIHSNCFPIRKCPLVHIVYFLLFAVSLKTSYRWYHTFFFLIGKRCIYVERVYSWASEKWKKISSSLVTVFLSPGGSFQKAFRPYKKKNVSYMIYLLRDLDFFGLGKILSLCAQDGTYPHHIGWALFFGEKKEKFSIRVLPDCFMNTCCQRKLLGDFHK